jgi:tetratricopeptide (TPR) repeat protein
MPAVRLFVQCAQRVQPMFALSDANAGHVLRICRLVQGMPLGLELAAAWTDVLTPDEIAAEIERSSRFLEAGWRNVPERQRSMAAVFEWSWRLLRAEEQQGLCRLSIFRGGWTREAAEQVAGVSLRVLSGLVRKSLLRWSEPTQTSGRYEMLEPLRQLAAERLGVESDAVAARHSEHYLRMVAAQERRLIREEPQPAIAIFQAEIDNVRQAWAWAVTHACADLLDISAYFVGFYLWSGQLSSSPQTYRLAAERLRTQLETSDPRVLENQVRRRTLGKLLALAAAADLGQGQYARAYAEAQEAVAIGVETGGTEGEAYARLTLAVAHVVSGMEGAHAQILRARDLARTARERGELSEVLIYVEWRCYFWMALDANRRGDLAAARRWANDGLALSRQLETLRGELSCLEMLAVAEREAGDGAAARRYLEQMWERSRLIGHPWDEGVAQHGLGEVLAQEGCYAEARDLMERSLAAFRVAGDATREAAVLASQVRLYLAQGDVDMAWAPMEQLERFIATGAFQYNIVQWDLARALLAERAGDNAQALAAAERALSAARQTGQRPRQADALVIIGRVCEHSESWEQAAAAHAEALAAYERLGLAPQTAEPLAGLVRIALRHGDTAAAGSHAEPLLAILTAHPWAGLGSPFALHLACYRALKANQDARAPQVLCHAQERLKRHITS